MVSNVGLFIGGTRSSGMGREGGIEAIHDHLTTKLAQIAL